MTRTHFILLLVSLVLFGAAPSSFAQTTNLKPLPANLKLLASGWQDETMLTASSDGYCRWWTADGTCRDSFAFGFDCPRNAAALFTKNSHFLLLQTADATFDVWDVVTRTKIWEKTVGSGIAMLAISPNNRFMGVAFRAGIVVYDSTGLEIAHFSHDEPPASLAISDKGLTMVGYRDKTNGSLTTKIWGPNAQKPPFEKVGAALKNPEPNQATLPIEVKLPPTKNAEPTPPAVKSGDIYALAIGTFSSEANARKRLDDARKWGFEKPELIQKAGKFCVFAQIYDTYETAWQIKKSLEKRYSIHAAVVKH